MLVECSVFAGYTYVGLTQTAAAKLEANNYMLKHDSFPSLDIKICSNMTKALCTNPAPSRPALPRRKC